MNHGMALRQVALQPQHLRQFHLDADFAANIVEGQIARRVDVRCLGGSAVVHPHDDVAPRVAILRHRHRLAIVAHRDQRARGIEANAPHIVGMRTRSGLTHRSYHLRPDVGRRLLVEVRTRIELLDRPGSERKLLARVIEQAGTHAGRAHIHAKKALRVHVRSSLHRR